MKFGPLELQACGENNFTIKSLGLLAFRPDLAQRFLQFLCPGATPASSAVSMLFFSRIGEGFFREAIERAGRGPDLGKFEARLNLALGLPDKFRWARTKEGRLIQPAKWQQRHIHKMLEANGKAGDHDLETRLAYVQDFVNTEPDIVLQWDKQLAIVEIKVLSGEGMAELARQRDLAHLLAGLLGWQTHFFYVGPDHGPRPTIPNCRFIAWADIAELFDDVPEITNYISNFAFYYKGVWQSMVSPSIKQPSETAFDLLMSRPVRGARKAPAPPGPDPWSIEHLDRDYFQNLFELCRREKAWPVAHVWLGITGAPYIERGPHRGRMPNAMVECLDGSTWISRGSTLEQGEFSRQRMRRWSYEEISETFALN